MKRLIKKGILESIHIGKQMLEDDKLLSLIYEISQALVKALKNKGEVILFGNGGSAADAQHVAAELVGKYYLDRDPLPAIALTVNTSSLTAIGNDYSFADVFAGQLAALGEAGDVVIGISTSGNSENVIQALKTAKEKGLITIGCTGRDGGTLKDIVDYCIHIPSDDTPRIQEGHITVGHIICEIVEKELFGVDGAREA